MSLAQNTPGNKVPKTSIQKTAQTITRTLSLLAFVLSLIPLLGWALDNLLATQFLPDLPRIKFNAALCYALIALAVWVSTFGLRKRRLTWILTLIPMAIAVVTLGEHLTMKNFGIDELVVSDTRGPFIGVPGRMAIITAISILLFGLGVIVKRARFTVALGALSFLYAYTSIVAFSQNFVIVLSVPTPNVPSLPATLAILVLGLAMVFSQPEAGFTRLLLANSSAGSMLRRTLPAVILVPAIISWVALLGYQHGSLDLPSRAAFFTCSVIVLFAALIFQNGRQFDADERELQRLRSLLEAKAKEKGSQLDAVLENSSDFIAAVDCELRFIAMNSAFKKEFKRLYNMEVKIGDSAEEGLAVFPGDFERGIDAWKRALQGEELTRTEPLGSSGNIYEFRNSPITDDKGKIIGALSIIHDVTVQVKSQLVLAQAKEEAEQANQAKSTFLASITHELRSPVSLILGHSESLLKRIVEEDERRSIATIHRNGQALLSLINDILDLTKVDSGQMVINPTKFCLPSLIADLVEELRGRARSKGLALRWNIEGIIPELLETDPVRLRQILQHLITNSIKFTDKGSIDIQVKMETSQTGKELTFDITDTGIGIAPDQHAKLFQPFFKPETSGRSFGGTGLGLLLSKKFASLLGGDVRLVTSEEGEGSVFRLQLPVSIGPETKMVTGAVLRLYDPKAMVLQERPRQAL